MTDRQISVCMYTPTGRGGHARYSHELLGALASDGQGGQLEVCLVTSSDLSSEFRSQAYPIFDFLPQLLHRRQFRDDIQWAVRRFAHFTHRELLFAKWLGANRRYNCVHIQEFTPWMSPLVFHRIKALDRRIVFTVHNVHPHERLPLVPRLMQTFWTKTALRMCDALIVHTEQLKKELSGLLGAGHPPIFIVPHAIWAPSLADQGASGESSLRDPKRLLFFGTLRQNKGILDLVTAMKELPGYTLTIAGEPTDMEYYRLIERLVAILPPGRVKLNGSFVEEGEIPGLFRKNGLVIIPYTSFSAQSGVLHMAVAYGLPVVATDVGSLGEAVREWKVGRVAKPGDPKDLAAAIRDLSTDNRYEEALRSVEAMRAANGWNRTAEQTAGVYRWIMETRCEPVTN